ncbi:MAG: response regulator [Syntrophobacteraceae bacterium]
MDESILVVDDERDFLESMRRYLIISGYTNCRFLSDPREALLLVESGEDCDIALLDITLPGMSGTELLDRIKSVSPATQCIMVTAISEAEMASQCMKKGAFDYLVKPFSGNDLLRSIKRALDKKRSLGDPPGSDD